MKKLLSSALLIPVVLGGLSDLNAQGTTEFQSASVVLSNESKLTINGQSNVNDFSCVSEHDLENDSLSYQYNFMGTDVELQGNPLTLKVDNFNCGKRGINRDFKKTLKHEEYPEIRINVKQLNGRESLDSLPTMARVDIELAGVTKEFDIDLSEVSLYEDKTQVKGKKTLRMSEFNLNPPSPLFGLIKIKDEMVIDFNLIIVGQ
ncbi:YceI family protein [Balneola sp. MJW-20]|uniref:YceI family protein n=1 Tax=Gracilimonas aurantiaca TaxID=3234185 RepID=UPI0034669618